MYYFVNIGVEESDRKNLKKIIKKELNITEKYIFTNNLKDLKESVL